MGEDKRSESSLLTPAPAEQLWRLWRQGERPAVVDFLAGFPGAAPAEVAAALLVDQRERWRVGERIPAEDYLGLFPHLSGDFEFALELIYGEYLLSEELGEAPELTPYLGRFPAYADRLRLQLELHRAIDKGTSACHRAPSEGAGADFTAHRSPAEPAAGEPIHPPADGPPASSSSRVGPYRLLERLGEGGMGEVWMARQDEPIERRVAVKLIKPGMDSAHVLARFEQERQALALMDHPNIAKVLDAGQSVGGRPYFVMELVKGIPITRYCDQERLTLKERLGLFLDVCSAVQHAHQKGIIHRDLKPSNVLVALQDGRAAPKVIDFGVAKATGQRLTELTIVTEVGVMIGSLEYMAPEQAELTNLDIDTRADIYSLGVLLYELLTGAPPFAVRQLRSVAWTEMLRIIREVEPPRPSARLGSSEALAKIAAQRKTEPKKLVKQVRGELDWITMKCLEKECGRRYETANGLAMDVRRYLSDEPVVAGPPGSGYRLRKFLRRNKGPVLAAAAVLLALLGGFAGTAWQAMRAERARQAESERADGEREANELALERLTQLEKAYEILASVFSDLDPKAEEKGGPALRVQLGEYLDRAAARLEREPVGDPVTLTRLQSRLALSLWELGHYDKAQRLLEKARRTCESTLGSDHPNTLNCKRNLILLYREQEEYDKAESLLRAVLDIRRGKPGLVDPETLRDLVSLINLYDQLRQPARAEPLYRELAAFRKQQDGPEAPAYAYELYALGLCQLQQRKYPDAELVLRQALSIYEKKADDAWQIARTKMALGVALHGQRKLTAAEPFLLGGYEGLKQRESVLSAYNLQRLTEGLQRLIRLYEDSGKKDEAAKWQAEREQRQRGFVRDWLILSAPIPFAGRNGARAVDQEQIPGEAKLRPRARDELNAGGNRLAWKEHRDAARFVDFASVYGLPSNFRVAYCVCYILSEAERSDLVLRVGSDDQAKVYLNGKEVYKFVHRRAFHLEQDEVKPLALRKGVNVLVFKVVNETEAWAGSLRFVDQKGRPAEGLRFRLEP
jgi:serine/threonine protein kinase/tetratricopeptide (TPR) repeat protein